MMFHVNYLVCLLITTRTNWVGEHNKYVMRGSDRIYGLQ